MAYPFFPTKNSFWCSPKKIAANFGMCRSCHMSVLLPVIAATWVMLSSRTQGDWIQTIQFSIWNAIWNSPPTNQSGGMQCLHFWCPLNGILIRRIYWTPAGVLAPLVASRPSPSSENQPAVSRTAQSSCIVLHAKRPVIGPKKARWSGKPRGWNEVPPNILMSFVHPWIPIWIANPESFWSVFSLW